MRNKKRIRSGTRNYIRKREENKINLYYFKGLIDEKKLEEQEIILKKAGIRVTKYDKNGKTTACSIEDFANSVYLVINSDIFKSLSLGIVTNVTYDLLKSTIFWMWNSLIGKTINKLIGSDTTVECKEVTFGLKIKIDEGKEINFRLEGDIDDSDKKYAIDKAFQMSEELLLATEEENRKFYNLIGVYNQKNKSWIVKDKFGIQRNN